MTPEKAVKEAIRKYLKSIGAYVFMPVQTGYGKRTLDCLVCHKGRFYAIEAKKEFGVATPAQEGIMNDIASSGGGVCAENSTALLKVKEMIKP